MKSWLERLLPSRADNHYQGRQIASVVFLIIAVISMIRSIIHMMAPDGGAGSIAGMDLSVAGAEGIVLTFALWGSSQLLYAVIQLVVWFRYRALIPFMYLLLSLEMLMRMIVGRVRPVYFVHTPPGAVANRLLLPLALGMLWLSLPRAPR